MAHAATNRIVLKIGSAVIAPDGVVDEGRVQSIAAQCARARDDGRQVLIVSSGAVAAGRGALKMSAPPRVIVQKQAAAAVGQPRLMSQWRHAFESHGVVTAQALLTADDIEDRTRAVNARHTLAELLRRGCLPIINENDAVSHDELRVGDNDRLAALVATLIDADLLLMLSSADGLRRDGGAGEIIETVEDIDSAAVHVAAQQSADGTGGMTTKLDAMRIATSCGVAGLVVGGDDAANIERAIAGENVGTRFLAGAKQSARRGWIGHAARPEGAIVVDDGARRALQERGASLLPVGVTNVEGRFASGAVVDVRTASGESLGRGIVAYSSEEITAIAGKPTDRIEAVLGYDYSDEVIHRDDLSLAPAPSRSRSDG